MSKNLSFSESAKLFIMVILLLRGQAQTNGCEYFKQKEARTSLTAN